MKRIISAVKFDILFQFRYGFYYAYLLISALYILLLRTLPVAARETALILVIISDTSVLGLFFIGGMVLLEKGQNTLENLFVTPLRVSEYFVSKVVSLTFLSLVMSLATMILGDTIPRHLVTFLTGVALSSVLFILIGLIIAARSKDVNRYLINSAIYTMVFSLPALDFFGILKSPLFYILPTQSSLTLMKSAFRGGSVIETGLAITVFIIWIVIAFVWAKKWFYDYIILNIGENKCETL